MVERELSNKEMMEEIDSMICRLNGFRSMIAKRIENERKENEKRKK